MFLGEFLEGRFSRLSTAPKGTAVLISKLYFLYVWSCRPLLLLVLVNYLREKHCYFSCGSIGHPRADSKSALCGYRPLSLVPVTYRINAKRCYFPCLPISHYRAVKVLDPLH